MALALFTLNFLIINLEKAFEHLNIAASSPKLEDHERSKLVHDLAICLLFRHRYQEAKFYYYKLLQDSSYQGLPRIAVLFGLAECHKSEKNYTEASLYYNSAIQMLDELLQIQRLQNTSEVKMVRQTLLNSSRMIASHQQNHQRSTSSLKIK